MWFIWSTEKYQWRSKWMVHKSLKFLFWRAPLEGSWSQPGLGWEEGSKQLQGAKQAVEANRSSITMSIFRPSFPKKNCSLWLVSHLLLGMFFPLIFSKYFLFVDFNFSDKWPFLFIVAFSILFLFFSFWC